MTWDIESAEEMEVARKAIEEYRKTQVRHVGLHACRMNLECEQSIRERAFAQGWKREATKDNGAGTLEMLLCTDPGKNGIIRHLTPLEATAAATVIQWLGTNCGWCFLLECLKTAGYSEPRKIEGRQ